MTRNQTRRSVEVSSELHDRLLRYCDEHDCSVSSILERVLAGDLSIGPMPPPKRDWISTTPQEKP